VTTSSSARDLSRQSPFSEPGGLGDLFDAIEPTIDAVSTVSRNVIVHYREAEGELPPDTRDDINLRWIDAILAADQRRHNSPLTEARPETRRVQGCCRDHSLLCVAILRSHGIPARTRVGFASYFNEGWHTDHVIVEAQIDGGWRCFDPEVATPSHTLEDPTNIPLGPDSSFLTASQAWMAHRERGLDVSRFGASGDIGISGDWFVYDYVIAEVAHRFGHELLLWDLWGTMRTDLSQVPEADLQLVDEIAELGIRADDGDGSAELQLYQRFVEEDRINPRNQVRSLSPAGGVWEIDLRTRRRRVIGDFDPFQWSNPTTASGEGPTV
jgi:hypothetical protein